MTILKWGMHRISDCYAYGIGCGLPDGRYVHAVALPYYANVFQRIRAAWRVLRGDLYAFEWPKAGDLENALREPTRIQGNPQ